MRVSLVVLFWILLGAVSPAYADFTTGWMHRGPGTGGGMPAVFPHPTDPDVVLTSADMVGPYRTDDGAATWKHCGFQDGTSIMNLVFDPATPEVVFVAAHDGIYRSVDGGWTWDPFADNETVGYESLPSSVNDAHFVMPMLHTGDHLYVGHNYPEGEGRISRYDFGSGSWHTGLTTGPGPTLREIISVGDDLFAISYGGLYRSADLGESWTALEYCTAPPGSLSCWGFNLAAHEDTLYVLAGVSNNGTTFPGAQVYRSDDLGENWTVFAEFAGFSPQLNRGKPPFKLIDVSPVTGTMVVARVDSLPSTYARKEAGDNTWTIYSMVDDYDGHVDPSGQPFERIAGRGLSGIGMVRASPCSQDWYFAGFGFLAMSRDDGLYWEHNVEGLWNTVAFCIAQCPNDPTWVLMGQGDNELLWSLDGGWSWTNFSYAMAGEVDSLTSGMVPALAFDPRTDDQALAVFTLCGRGYAGKGMGNRYLLRIHKEPFEHELVHHFPDVAGENPTEENRHGLVVDYCSPDSIFITTRHKADDALGGPFETGVLISGDGGQTFSTEELGLGPAGVGVSPGVKRLTNLQADRLGNVYLTTNAMGTAPAGLYRWEGSAWALRHTLAQDQSFCEGTLTAGPNAGHLLVGVITLSADSTCTTRQSTDFGTTWETIRVSETAAVVSMAVAPWDPDLLYLCETSPERRRPDERFGVYRSDTGGATWYRDQVGLVIPNFHAMEMGSDHMLRGASAGGCMARRLLDQSGIEEGEDASAAARPPEFLSCSPNPGGQELSLRFTLGEPGPVELTIFDPSGRLVQRLSPGALAAGTHALEWNGRDAAGRLVGSGVYTFKLRAPGGVIRGRGVLIR